MAGIVLSASIAATVNGQSINNRNWKAFIADPINDTVTLHIHSDSSFVSNGKGEIFLTTKCTIQGDTLTFSDYGNTGHECPDPGKYKIVMNGNTFTFTLIEDACDGRAHALEGLVWREAKMN